MDISNYNVETTINYNEARALFELIIINKNQNFSYININIDTINDLLDGLDSRYKLKSFVNDDTTKTQFIQEIYRLIQDIISKHFPIAHHYLHNKHYSRMEYLHELSIDTSMASLHVTRVYSITNLCGEVISCETEDNEKNKINHEKLLTITNLSIGEYFHYYFNSDYVTGNDCKFDFSPFTNLEYLYMCRTYISSINLDNNQRLEELELRGVCIPEINLKNNTNLKRLDLSHNNLKTIDLSNNKLLERLTLCDNPLKCINLEQNTTLKELDLSTTDFTNVNVSKNVLLTKLKISGSDLTSVDLSNNRLLEELFLERNKLSQINLKENKKLKTVSLRNNKLTKLDVSKNILLAKLDIQNNDIKFIDISKNPMLLRNNISKDIQVID